MANEHEQDELLAQVAHLYFEQGKDQNTIAQRLRVSRSSVSRLLTQARKRGVVEIRIHYPLALVPEMGAALRERFSLKEALVLRAAANDVYDAKMQVARLAARYLDEHISAGDTIALSRGSTLHATIEEVTLAPRRNVRVVQLVGTLRTSRGAEDDGNLARALAQKIGGEYYNLTAPLLVENVATRHALMQEPAICEVLEFARKAQLALVGIGALDRLASSIVREKILARAEVQSLRQRRAVGEICSQYYDANGVIVSTELNERTMALSLCALQEIPSVIGVATGPHKAKAILGALRGHFLTTLITDDETAALVLAQDTPRGKHKRE